MRRRTPFPSLLSSNLLSAVRQQSSDRKSDIAAEQQQSSSTTPTSFVVHAKHGLSNFISSFTRAASNAVAARQLQKQQEEQGLIGYPVHQNDIRDGNREGEGGIANTTGEEEVEHRQHRKRGSVHLRDQKNSGNFFNDDDNDGNGNNNNTAALVKMMNPAQRWYRRQFLYEQSCLECSKDDVFRAIQLVAEEAGHIDLDDDENNNNQDNPLTKSAQRVVDILVGTVGTPVFVTPGDFLEHVCSRGSLLPSGVHAAVVRDLLVTRRECWNLLLVASASEAAVTAVPPTRGVVAEKEDEAASATDDERRNRFLDQLAEKASRLEQELLTTVNYTTPTETANEKEQQETNPQQDINATTSSSFLDQCRADLSPIVTRYALEDASILIEEHNRLFATKTRASSSSSAVPSFVEEDIIVSPQVEASVWLQRRLDEICASCSFSSSSFHHQHEQKSGDDIDGVPSSSLHQQEQEQQTSVRDVIQNKLIQQFVSSGDWLPALRCWSFWMLDLTSSSPSSKSSLEQEIHQSFHRYAAIESATVDAAVAAWCRVGLWQEAVKVLERHEFYLCAERVSQRASTKTEIERTENDNDDGSGESTFHHRLQILLDNAGHLPSALRYVLSQLVDVDAAPAAGRPSAKSEESTTRSLILQLANAICTLDATCPRGIVSDLANTFLSSRGSSCWPKKALLMAAKSSSGASAFSSLVSLLCLSGNWHGALALVREQESGRRNGPSFFVVYSSSTTERRNIMRPFSEQLAAAGAPWPDVRDALTKEFALAGEDQQKQSTLLISRLIKCAFAQGACDAAMKLFDKNFPTSSSEHDDDVADAMLMREKTLTMIKLLDNEALVNNHDDEVDSILHRCKSHVHFSFSFPSLLRAGAYQRALEVSLDKSKAEQQQHSASRSNTPSDSTCSQKNEGGAIKDLAQTRDCALFFASSNQPNDNLWVNLLRLMRMTQEVDLLDVWWSFDESSSSTSTTNQHDPIHRLLMLDRAKHSPSGFGPPLFRFLNSSSCWAQLVSSAASSSSSSSSSASTAQQLRNHPQKRDNPLLVDTVIDTALRMPRWRAQVLKWPLPSPTLTLDVAERLEKSMTSSMVGEKSDGGENNATSISLLVEMTLTASSSATTRRRLHQKNPRQRFVVLFESSRRDEHIAPVAPWWEEDLHSNNNNNSPSTTKKMYNSSLDAVTESIKESILSRTSASGGRPSASVIIFSHLGQVAWSDVCRGKCDAAAQVENFFAGILAAAAAAASSPSSSSAASNPQILFPLANIAALMQQQMVSVAAPCCWPALAGLLRFMRNHLEYTSLPLETFTLLVECAAFALDSGSDNRNNKNKIIESPSQRKLERDVTECFEELMKFGSAAARRAAAQRLASRSLHRSSWEEALASLDFAVCCCGAATTTGTSSSSSSSSLLLSPSDIIAQQNKSSSSVARSSHNNSKMMSAVGQNAMWRVATTPTPSHQPPAAVHALWKYLSMMSQPVVVPRSLLHSLVDCGTAFDCEDENQEGKKKMQATMAAAFVVPTAKPSATAVISASCSSSTSSPSSSMILRRNSNINSFLRRGLIASSVSWVVAARVLAKMDREENKNNMYGSKVHTVNMVVRSAIRSGAIEFALRAMASMVVVGNASSFGAARSRQLEQLLLRPLIANNANEQQNRRSSSDVVRRRHQRVTSTSTAAGVDNSNDESFDAFFAARDDDNEDVVLSGVDGDATKTTAASQKQSDATSSGSSFAQVFVNAGVEPKTVFMLAQKVLQQQQQSHAQQKDNKLSMLVELLQQLETTTSCGEGGRIVTRRQQAATTTITSPSQRIGRLDQLEQQQRFRILVGLLRSVGGHEDEADVLQAVSLNRFRKFTR